jgi:hypothetical protein
MTDNDPSSSSKLRIAIISAIAVIAASYIGYMATIRSASLPIEATETAEAIRTSVAIATQTVSPAGSSPEPTSTIVSIPTFTTTPSVPTPFPISGVWEGMATGKKNGQVMASIRLTTITIPSNCQVGMACGTSESQDGCNYQMILSSIQGNTYSFDINLLDNSAEFCSGYRWELNIKTTKISENQVSYFYHSKHDDGTIVDREGVLTKK